MLPPSTRSPPNFFKPNRCEFESRPFRDDPTPFLCAITHLRFPIADCRLIRSFQSAIGNGNRQSSYPILSIFNVVYPCRWPLVRLYCLRRFFLKTTILGSRPWSTTVAVAFTPS